MPARLQGKHVVLLRALSKLRLWSLGEPYKGEAEAPELRPCPRSSAASCIIWRCADLGGLVLRLCELTLGVVRASKELRPSPGAAPRRANLQGGAALGTLGIACIPGAHRPRVLSARYPPPSSAQLKRRDHPRHRCVVEHDVLMRCNPRPVSLQEYARWHRRLESERAAEDHDATQRLLVHEQKLLDCSEMPEVLVQRILETILLPEVHRRPESVGRVPEYPAGVVLEFHDEHAEARDDEMVNLGRAARCRNDDVVEVVVLAPGELKRPVG